MNRNERHLVVPTELHKELKIEASKRGMTLKELAIEKLRGKHAKRPLKW